MSLRFHENAYISPQLDDDQVELIRQSAVRQEPARITAKSLGISEHFVGAARRYLSAMDLLAQFWTAETRANMLGPRDLNDPEEEPISPKPPRPEMTRYWRTKTVEFCVIHPAVRKFYEADGWRYDRKYASGSEHIQMDRVRR